MSALLTPEICRTAGARCGRASGGKWEHSINASSARRYRIEDVTFHTVGDVALLARLYVPVGSRPFVAVVEVHGGAWIGGDRRKDAILNEDLAASGVVVMAVDFRMPPRAGYPASVADINLAIRWLKANAGRYGVEPKNVGGVGFSSGGHQLLLTALRPFDRRYAAHDLRPPVGATADASLSCIVLCWPVSDPLARYRMAKERGLGQIVAAHEAYWPDERAMEEGNPQLILDRGQEVFLLPVLVIQGTRDENLTPDMTERFAAAYRTRGGDVRVEFFKDGHITSSI